jgi:adenylate kinase family enzyme
LDYYRAEAKLVKVDGKRGIEEVSEEIIDVLDLKSVKAK